MSHLRSIIERISDFLAYIEAEEAWRPVDGWPGYSVSSWGRVRSKYGRYLKPAVVQGYDVVTLCHWSRKFNARVHRLVALAFFGTPPFEGAIVAHNDGNSLNNHAINLRWASARENQFDRVRHGTRCRGSRVFGAKLREEQIPAIRQRIASGETYAVIADEFAVSKSTIHLIAHNRIWRSAGGAAWEIKNVA